MTEIEYHITGNATDLETQLAKDIAALAAADTPEPFTGGELAELLIAADHRITELEQLIEQGAPVHRNELFTRWLSNAQSARDKVRAMCPVNRGQAPAYTYVGTDADGLATYRPQTAACTGSTHATVEHQYTPTAARCTCGSTINLNVGPDGDTYWAHALGQVECPAHECACGQRHNTGR